MNLSELEAGIRKKRSVQYEDTGIRIRLIDFETKSGTQLAHRVDIPKKLAGSRMRKQFPGLAEAVKWIEKWLKERETTTATVSEAADFNSNLPRLREQGVSIGELLDFYEERFIHIGDRLKLSEIQARLLETLDKRRDNKLSDHQRRKIVLMGERIKKDLEDCYADELTAERALEWLETAKSPNGEPWSGKTRNHYLAHLNRLLEFAISKKSLKSNPLAEIDDEDRKSLLGYKLPSPEVLSLEEATALLTKTKEHCPAMLACVVVSLFDGLRQHEAWQLEVSDFDFDDGEVHVSERIAKTRSIRFVQLSEASLAWLATCELPQKGKLLPFSVKSAEGRWATIMKNAKVHKQNALRHTAASVMCRLQGEVYAKTQLGHAENSSMFFKHYRKAMTKKQAEAMAGLKPELEESDTVPFSEAASA